MKNYSEKFKNGLNGISAKTLAIHSDKLYAGYVKKINEIWKNHPNYHRIESTENFIEKVNKATHLIHNMLPDCCRNNISKEIV